MGIPERVKRMREEIAAEVATKATAEATATTALKKDKWFVNILKYRIFDIIKHRFVSIPYNLIHNISTINDINILLDFISISEKVKNIDKINVLIEKKINKNQ